MGDDDTHDGREKEDPWRWGNSWAERGSFAVYSLSVGFVPYTPLCPGTDSWHNLFRYSMFDFEVYAHVVLYGVVNQTKFSLRPLSCRYVTT